MEQIFLETKLQDTENNEVIGDSQHGVTGLLGFCYSSGGQGRAAKIIYMDLCRAFDTLPNVILVSKLERCEFCQVELWEDKKLAG